MCLIFEKSFPFIFAILQRNKMAMDFILLAQLFIQHFSALLRLQFPLLFSLPGIFG